MAKVQRAPGAPKKKSGKVKSHKADGTPKKRWSAAERSERGHGVRTSGGRSRSDRPEREGSFSARPERFRPESARPDRASQDDRPRKFDRDERPRSFDRDERPRSFDHDERPRRFDRDERPRAKNRDDRPRFERDDRPRRFDREDRPSFNRDDRPRTANRDERPRFDRDDRSRSFNRDDRPRKFDRDDRPSFSRDDRPRTANRDERPRFDRDDRPRKFDRDDRPRTSNREDRPRFEREDRPRFERDDRPRKFERDDRPRSSDRDDREHRHGAHSERGFRPHQDRFDRGDSRRFDRSSSRSDEQENPDQMSWTPTEADASTSVSDAAATGEGFAGLGLRAELVNLLQSQGIVDPFPIQAATIPDALEGLDVLGRGQTGSGKTLGFGLPMLSRLAEGQGREPRGIVVVPTRELAMQVADVLSPLASTLKLKVMLVAGGMAYGPQIKAFARGVDVVVATPGRLIDLMDQGAVDLSNVETAVLDEADHMADLGFLPDVRRILDSVPVGGQRLLFSATLDRGVDTVVREYLNSPVTHQVDGDTASVTTMDHQLLHIRPADKQPLTAEIANRDGRTLAFVRTQRGADRVAEQLRDAGVMAGALHGGLTQGARSRVMGAFKEGTVPVLVATDVAARGIHVDDVSCVLQIDPPAGSKDYLHRAGRTARAGGKGVVVTLVLPHQRREISRLVQRAGVDASPLNAAPDDERVYRATGARNPSKDPIVDADYQAIIAPPKAKRGGGARRGGPGGRGQGGGGFKGRGYAGGRRRG